MATRKPDVIRIETSRGTFDKFSSLEVVNDIVGPTEAVFEIGDDGAWDSLEKIVAPGELFSVYCNDRLRLMGRAEMNEIPGSVDRGVVITLGVRTKMADARYASAEPSISLKDTTLKDFILKLYEPLNVFLDSFEFAPAADRLIMTGKTTMGGGPGLVDLETLKLEQCKVNPPETIFEAAEKHLRRFHMSHWDTCNGKILVGHPDDQQSPMYKLTSKKGAAAKGNNLLSWKKIRDWSEVPSDVWVFGGVGGKDVRRATVQGVSVDLDLAKVFADNGHFFRKVLIPSEGARSKELANSQARREVAARSKRKDAWEFTCDGWSCWNGSEQVPYAHNTVADLDVDAVGGPQGPYLIHRVSLRWSIDQGATTVMNAVAKGIWDTE